MSHYPSNSILIQYLIDRIRDSAKAAIPFSALMESCLYHPEGGYYMSSRPKIGKAGDFYTSSNVGSAMGEMIAVYIQRQAAERGWAPDTFTIVEWGAGNGRLAGHINERLRRDRCNGCRYAIVEASPYHAQLAKERLSGEDLPVSWWTEADYRREAGGSRLFVLANELLDAFPVERIRASGGQIEQCFVVWEEAEQSFLPVWLPAEPEVKRWLNRYRIELPEGRICDAGIAMSGWLGTMLRQASEAEFIFIDYGDVTEELTAEHRADGTLLCYHRHRAHDNPWIHIGEQDITAMVDFSVCQQAALEAGALIRNYMTQQAFLLEQGLLQELVDHAQPDPFSPEARRNRAIRQLLLSDHLSERFRVLLLARDASA
ncbi:SAM-dependent methyltransferase [Paenibacillus melissococcoides]|uniref:SAM-dependent methyltransferase n=1 Tax=Paenibacillus melissococcoides TaxID=2912268 RepID=A0ABM9G163_9BACL|nr:MULTISPECIES: SAM-dependent methyltransferase [Paenibacillus]GIO78900.1 SAM-dependent methyltransferase [Paenibacillus dendritiformis]CAH8245219.1 SAM-dependent methyltransferase [Paenibacillus melissococcoides]CAH8710325.1 SAM-dependent methyltransferase [Paenibacillus melissococcoides]CAH8711094.1 SAM-dependent methyltransferase [Paenibacillus melissococcoides]